MKKEYFSPQLKVEFLLMENSLAAGSAPKTSVNPASNTGEIKTMWEVGDDINGEIEL